MAAKTAAKASENNEPEKGTEKPDRKAARPKDELALAALERCRLRDLSALASKWVSEDRETAELFRDKLSNALSGADDAAG